MEDNGVAAGAWRVRYNEVHGRRYGLRDVALSGQDAFLCIEGSGGARSYTETVCTFPGTNQDEKHALLIAAAPDLLEALKTYMHAMEGFAEAVRSVTGTAYPWEAQDIERSKALAAIAKATTP